MKPETVHYQTTHSATFTGRQMAAIRKSWCEVFERTPKEFDEDATEGDILVEAERLGLVQLPDEWSAD